MAEKHQSSWITFYSRLGDKPGGLAKAADNLRKLRKEFDTENVGILRFDSKMMNPEGDGRVILVSDPDDIRAAFG